MEGSDGGGQNLGLRLEKKEGRCTGGGKKSGKKKLRKVAGTDIKGCGWQEVCTPHPPPCPSPSPPPPPFSENWRKCRIQVLRSQETVSLQ